MSHFDDSFEARQHLLREEALIAERDRLRSKVEEYGAALRELDDVLRELPCPSLELEPRVDVARRLKARIAELEQAATAGRAAEEGLRGHIVELEQALRQAKPWVEAGTEFQASDSEARALLARIAAALAGKEQS